MIVGRFNAYGASLIRQHLLLWIKCNRTHFINTFARAGNGRSLQLSSRGAGRFYNRTAEANLISSGPHRLQFYRARQQN